MHLVHTMGSILATVSLCPDESLTRMTCTPQLELENSAFEQLTVEKPAHVPFVCSVG